MSNPNLAEAHCGKYKYSYETGCSPKRMKYSDAFVTDPSARHPTRTENKAIHDSFKSNCVGYGAKIIPRDYVDNKAEKYFSATGIGSLNQASRQLDFNKNLHPIKMNCDYVTDDCKSSSSYFRSRSPFMHAGKHLRAGVEQVVQSFSPKPASEDKALSSVLSPPSSFASSVILHRGSSPQAYRGDVNLHSAAYTLKKEKQNIGADYACSRPTFHADKTDAKDDVTTSKLCVNRCDLNDSGIYVPGVDLLMDDTEEILPIDLISHFSKTPVSSKLNDPDCPFVVENTSSQFLNAVDSNLPHKPNSFAATSSMSAPSAGMELVKAAKARYAQLFQQHDRMQPPERQPLPKLHLHLSKDGTSPLPPGWQRAPNPKKTGDNHEGSADQDANDESNTYAYYYYHVRSRQTRWDPPVYPWDADPTDTLMDQTGEDDPEAPYNWGCASKFAVTHEEIEAMYARLRHRSLERQATELLHELAGRPNAPQGVAEQSFAIELYELVHNTLRSFRGARCKLGRILNDEDLYYLTKKLAQAVILKEVEKFHQLQTENSASLFSSTLTPEVCPAVRARVTTYLKKYMESKGAFYRRRLQQPPVSTVPHPSRESHQRIDVEPVKQIAPSQSINRTGHTTIDPIQHVTRSNRNHSADGPFLPVPPLASSNVNFCRR